MKALLKVMFAMALVVAMSACGNEKKGGAKFEDRGARALNVSEQTRQSLVPTSLVYGKDQSGNDMNMTTWMSGVRRLISASIPENYLLDVSPNGTGGNSNGVFLGVHLCLQGNYPQAIPSTAMMVIKVYDSAEAPPVPIYLTAESGNTGSLTSSGVVDARFADNYGSIRLYGQPYGGNYSVQVWFNNHLRYDGQTDSAGWQLLGTAYMTPSQLFSCQ